VPLKANTPPENSQRRGGAQPGHWGHGRRDIPDAEVTREEVVPGLEQCPYCGGPLDPKGSKPRTIIEVDPVRKEVIRYELAQRDCGRCHRTFTARPAGVFAKGLFGNQLLTHLAVEHYVQGVTLGHLSAQLAVGQGGLWAALHQLARRLADVPQRLLLEYRRAPVKHADETGWRNARSFVLKCSWVNEGEALAGMGMEAFADFWQGTVGEVIGQHGQQRVADQGEVGQEV
jgi:transposase